VFGNSPVIVLVKDPLPEPSFVRLPAIVGLGEVLQQTPLAVTGNPPADVMVPPVVAVVAVIEVTAVVPPTVGKSDTGSGSFFWQLKEMKASKRMRHVFFIQVIDKQT
jgi:hypothetical protein